MFQSFQFVKEHLDIHQVFTGRLQFYFTFYITLDLHSTIFFLPTREPREQTIGQVDLSTAYATFYDVQ